MSKCTTFTAVLALRLRWCLSQSPGKGGSDFGTVLLEDVEAGKGGISRSGRVADFLEKDPNSPSNLNNASIYMIEMDLIRELDSLRTEARLDLDCPFYDFGKHVFPRPAEPAALHLAEQALPAFGALSTMGNGSTSEISETIWRSIGISLMAV